MRPITREYVKSSFITFLTMFIIVIAPGLQNLTWGSLEAAGATGAVVMLARLAVKAAWEAGIIAFSNLADKLRT